MNYNDLHSEKELFAEIAKGNDIAFRTLFYRFGPKIRPFILNIVKREDVARELVQEVFLRVWIKREELTQVQQPASWIYRIASNLALTHFRRQNIESKVLQSIQHPVDDDELTHAFNVKELQSLINKAVSHLPAQRQKIFKMSREEGLSRKEIAAALNISENTVRNQLNISLQAVQNFIEDASGYYIPVIFLLSVSGVF